MFTGLALLWLVEIIMLSLYFHIYSYRQFSFTGTRVITITESRHDANFVIATTSDANSDDKVGMLTTLGFQWSELPHVNDLDGNADLYTHNNKTQQCVNRRDNSWSVVVIIVGCSMSNWMQYVKFMMGSSFFAHYNDVIMGTLASQITSLTIVYSTVYSDADQRKHRSSASLAFLRGIHRGPVNSPQKWPVTRKMFPFDDVIIVCACWRLTPTGITNILH